MTCEKPRREDGYWSCRTCGAVWKPDKNYPDWLPHCCQDRNDGGCQYPNGGCLQDDLSGCCPLCDEGGADGIAEYYSNQPEIDVEMTNDEVNADDRSRNP